MRKSQFIEIEIHIVKIHLANSIIYPNVKKDKKDQHNCQEKIGLCNFSFLTKYGKI